MIDLNTAILGLSALIALYSLSRHQGMNSRRATVDMVMQQKHDAKLVKANETVNSLLDDNKITRFADDEHKESDERTAILIVLNNYEFIAGAIKEKAFDLSLYQRMQHSKVVRDWKAFQPFVCHIRETVKRPTLFQDFEWLADKFDRKPLKRNKKN